MQHPYVLWSYPVGATGLHVAYGRLGTCTLTARRESLDADGVLRTSILLYSHFMEQPLKRCRGCGRWNAPWPWTDVPWEKTHSLAEYCSQRCQWRTQRGRFPRQRARQFAGYQPNINDLYPGDIDLPVLLIKMW
jgi:hypothetical protein